MVVIKFVKFLKASTLDIVGVCHADEIGYLFTTILTSTPEPGSLEDITQRRMCRLWANFAKFGNPSPYLDPLFNETTWHPVVDHNKIAFLDIDESLRIDYNPEPERMRFWEKIYSRGLLASKL